MKKLFHNFAKIYRQQMQVKFIEIVIYCNYFICFWIYLDAYAERMWDFMKEGEKNQWVFLVSIQTKSVGKLWRQGKKRKNSRTFMFSRSALTYQSWFTAPHKNLEGRLEILFSYWGALNRIAVEYCFSSTQERDVHHNWLRDAASAPEVRLHASPPLWESSYSGILALIQNLWKSA